MIYPLGPDFQRFPLSDNSAQRKKEEENARILSTWSGIKKLAGYTPTSLKLDLL
jgi:hypothetical protein